MVLLVSDMVVERGWAGADTRLSHRVQKRLVLVRVRVLVRVLVRFADSSNVIVVVVVVVVKCDMYDNVNPFSTMHTSSFFGP